MFKVGDKARLRVVDRSHAGTKCSERDGASVTITYVRDYYTPGDMLHLGIIFEDGAESGTHVMNLVPAHGPWDMEALSWV